MAQANDIDHEKIRRGRDVLLAVAQVMPNAAEVRKLHADLNPARERGYFLPNEDEAVREMFSRYLHAQGALLETVRELQPIALRSPSDVGTTQLQAFTVVWTATCIQMRAARFLLDEYDKDGFLRVKLDEGEPSFGIPPKQFTRIYTNFTRTVNVLRFFKAARYAEKHRAEIHALASDPAFAPVIDMLDSEQPFLELHRRYYTGRMLREKIDRVLSRPARGYRRVMFGLYKATGTAIATYRHPWHRKRVSRAIIHRIADILQPGDVIVTRKDDAMSNLFLPGFWPHAALYIGTREQRDALGVAVDRERHQRCAPNMTVLEARKDGVLFRRLVDTLRVDAFVVIRPRLKNEAQLRRALEKALTHEGKLYDFGFDFRRSDRLVCTELIYRTYHGIGDMFFELRRRAGRFCFSAEDLLDEALLNHRFEVLAIYGVKGNHFLTGERAVQALARSYGRDGAVA